jgi:hypothetical protein
MAIDFPNSPTVNDTYTAGGKTWQWNGTYWSAYGTSPILRASDTAPLSPNANDLWYETDTGSLFAYVDGYWVELGASAPVTASAGDLTGATLASNVVSSSLTSVGTLSSGAVPTTLLTGTTLPASVVSSSLTSVGTLGSLAVTGDVTRGGVSMPRGIMAYATRETTGLTTTLGDIGLSVTFTAVANRLYKYTFYCYASNSTASGVLGTFVTDSSNVIKEALNLYVVAGGNYTFQHLTYISTETAGTVTRKIRANTQFGSGTLFGPLYFFVEDIGAA